MHTTTKRSLVAATGALVLGGALVLPGLAEAQTTESFSVSPTTVQDGQTAVFTATGCEIAEVAETMVSIELLGNLVATNLPVTDGTATFELPITSESLDPGTYGFFAYCSDANDMETGFEYEEVAILTVVAPTTTTAAPTTSAPAAAAATRPAFTG